MSDAPLIREPYDENVLEALGRQIEATLKLARKGSPVLTVGVASLPSDVQAMAIHEIASFAAFDEDNDPHGEHDFGVFELAGQRLFWKIDYYDQNMDPVRKTQPIPRRRRAY